MNNFERVETTDFAAELDPQTVARRATILAELDLELRADSATEVLARIKALRDPANNIEGVQYASDNEWIMPPEGIIVELEAIAASERGEKAKAAAIEHNENFLTLDQIRDRLKQKQFYVPNLDSASPQEILHAIDEMDSDSAADVDPEIIAALKSIAAA